MKVAIIGPICEDKIIIKDQIYTQFGGLTFYTGQALVNLGVEVTVFGSFGNENPNWLKGFKFNRLHQIQTKNTLNFINIYPEDDPDIRIQKVESDNHKILVTDVKDYNFDEFEYVILGPLFHNNISVPLIKFLSTKTNKLVLSPQGMIRYTGKDKIIWKNPSRVLKILKYLDYLSFDEEELKFIAQFEDLNLAVKFIKDQGLKNLIITHGQHGSRLFLGEEDCRIKSFPPRKLVDPTGAGDSYLAGFIKAQELFSDPIKQGEFAAMTATMAIENHGPFSKSTQQVIRRLNWTV